MEVTELTGAPPPHAAVGAARRYRLASAMTATALLAVMLVLAAVSIVLSAISGHFTIPSVGAPVVIAIYAGVGFVVARHQPRNLEGWILLTAALLFFLSQEAGSYLVLRYHLGHTGLPFAQVAVLLVQLWVPAACLFPVVIVLFPDGALTRRWRRALWAYAGLVAFVTASAFAPAIAAVAGDHIHLADSFGDVANVGYPGQGAVSVAQPAAVLLIAVAWLAFIARPFFTWRRTRGERRQQLKWLACGGTVTIVLGVLGSGFAAFAARLKDAVDLDSVRDDLANVVHQALEPAHVSVWISKRG